MPADAPRVLLIEDDPQSAELLTAQLAHAGYAVDVASTGEAGLSSAGVRPPDAIVLEALPNYAPGFLTGPARAGYEGMVVLNPRRTPPASAWPSMSRAR